MRGHRFDQHPLEVCQVVVIEVVDGAPVEGIRIRSFSSGEDEQKTKKKKKKKKRKKKKRVKNKEKKKKEDVGGKDTRSHVTSELRGGQTWPNS